MSQPFELQPFTATPATAQLSLNGQVQQQGRHLGLRYKLTGNLAGVVVPQPVPMPQRQDDLWQQTCFEFFLGFADQPTYWEFNLAPSGNWNVYQFSAYRQGMRSEAQLTDLPIEVSQTPETFSLELDVDLSRFIPRDRPLILGITAVIEHRDDDISYWALTHSGVQADFHRRDSFTLALS